MAIGVCALVSLAAAGGRIHGIVVDQTGLAVPGATVELRDAARTVASTVTGADGSFALDETGDKVRSSCRCPGSRP